MATAAKPAFSMPAERFDNRFTRELPADPEQRNFRRQVPGAAWSLAEPTPVAAPRLLAWSREAAALLDLSEDELRDPAFAHVFGGNALLPGMIPYAACYGGHQFGNWAGQLGDGRAIGLGEYVNARGERWELQLKGAGPTPYSRTADGRAVLRSSIREFLCSEAMHHLGVPTTRALSLVGTGEEVIRDMLYDGHPAPEPGAVVCRLAPSFLRFGNFEIFTARSDFANLEKLVDFTIARDYPHLEGDTPEKRRRWFVEVCERTARMVCDWMRVGFVHGVMNTDNMSILGLTIDYGPYGWVDNYDPDWTPNTTDAGMHRYAFGRQSGIAGWNLACLANALVPCFGSVDELKAGIDRYRHSFTELSARMTLAKFGLATEREGDDEIVEQAFALMYQGEMDMTWFFRELAKLEVEAPSTEGLASAFYVEEKKARFAPALEAWVARYSARVRAEGRPDPERRAAMDAVNPRYVLRNYLAQEAIDLAHAGDFSRVHELLEVLRDPYVEKPGLERFADKRPDWARTKVGCSMLSCSS